MNSLEKVIENLTRFGQELDAFCHDLRDRTQDDGVRLMVYHIARWKRHIGLTISSLTSVEKEEFEKLSLSEEDLTFLSERVFADIFISSTAAKEELLDTVIEVLDVLVSYFDFLLDKPLSEKVKSFFKDLRNQQLEEIELLNKLKTVGG